MQERANNPTVKSEFDILQLLPRVANDNQVPCWYCPKYSKGTKKTNHSYRQSKYVFSVRSEKFDTFNPTQKRFSTWDENMRQEKKN